MDALVRAFPVEPSSTFSWHLGQWSPLENSAAFFFSRTDSALFLAESSRQEDGPLLRRSLPFFIGRNGSRARPPDDPFRGRIRPGARSRSQAFFFFPLNNQRRQFFRVAAQAESEGDRVSMQITCQNLLFFPSSRRVSVLFFFPWRECRLLSAATRTHKDPRAYPIQRPLPPPPSEGHRALSSGSRSSAVLFCVRDHGTNFQKVRPLLQAL